MLLPLPLPLSLLPLCCTGQASELAKRWHDSRQTYKAELQEPEENFQGLQKFLYRSLQGEGGGERERERGRAEV
jgi:hypothetical protein